MNTPGNEYRSIHTCSSRSLTVLTEYDSVARLPCMSGASTLSVLNRFYEAGY